MEHGTDNQYVAPAIFIVILHKMLQRFCTTSKLPLTWVSLLKPFFHRNNLPQNFLGILQPEYESDLKPVIESTRRVVILPVKQCM